MRFTSTLTRLVAGAAIVGLLAACGGGGQGSSLVPHNPGGGNGTSPAAKSNATFKVFVPSPSSNSSIKRPDYIASAGTSSLVISVQPTDPAEAAQWSTLYGASGFTICYNLFTNGAVASPLAPGVTVTPVVGPPAGYSVVFPFPSPPGQDTFTITQYAGACSSTNPYAPPTPGPGQTAANQILAQGVPYVVNIQPGQTNNFNALLFACTTGVPPSNPPPGGVCQVPGPVGVTTPTLGGTIAYVYMANATPALPITLPNPIPLPIQQPMREQGAFTTALSSVGIPIPIAALDSNGNPVPYTAPVVPGGAPSSGAFPKAGDGVSITHTESGTGGHFKLYLFDATTGAVAQNTEPIKLSQANALNCPTDCTLGGANGDPYVVVAAFDGSPAASSTSMTVSMAATINGTPQATQTLTIAPQSALFTAVIAPSAPGNGYADAAAPYTNAADILNTTGASGVAAAGQGYWVTDGGNMRLVGSAGYGVAGAVNLTAETLDNSSNLTAGQILAVDNSTVANAGSSTIIKSGVYVFDPVAHTSKPLAVQDLTTGNYVAFGAPNAIAFVTGGYVYVAAGNKIYVIDPQANGMGALVADVSNTYFLAEEIGQLPVTGLNAGSDTGFDMIQGTSASQPNLFIADTGNNRIVSVNVPSSTVSTGCVPGGAACTPAVISSGHPYVGLSIGPSGGFVATDSAGQIYTITGTGVATSLGLTGGAVKDGVVGVIGTNPLAPVPYTTQGNAGNFFNTTPSPITIPYNIAPFTAAGPILAGAAQTAVKGAPLNFALDTSYIGFGATAGTTKSGFGIAFISAAGANTALTSNSYLFTDGGSLRTLVP